MATISRERIYQSMCIQQYKEVAARMAKLYYPRLQDYDLNRALDYSIQKRFQDHKVNLTNTYTNKTSQKMLLDVADYIADKQPIVTAYGTMFKRHGTVPNPLGKVIQSFLDARTEHKNMMFKFPKGTAEFEKYNLLQQLDKIDANSKH